MNKLNWETFKPKFHESYHVFMKNIIESSEVYDIFQKLKSEKEKVVPASNDTFKAFEVDRNKIRVCIFGQDPYPQVVNNIVYANGRAFCCENYGKISPSLEKLYKGFENDCYNGLNLSWTPIESLQYLENEGVALFNTNLTTLKDKPGKHDGLWEPFWKQVFEQILSLNNGLIFIAMGKTAQKLVQKYHTPFIHHILECEHPVSAPYKMRDMEHNNVFSKANKILEQSNREKIEWLPIIPF